MMQVRTKLLCVFIFFIVFPGWQVYGFKPLKERSIRAVRSHEEIRIDGLLEEEVWQKGGYAHFTQSEPLDGTEPSEKTLVWVAYDDKALYVAARLFDSEPHKIEKRLGRRDDRIESDWFHFSVDTYFDRLSGFLFSVNPAGAVMDATLYNDMRRDYTWDGVWRWQTRVDDGGWTVELSIPYDQLRFPEKKEYVWGVFFSRIIRRKNETVNFVWIPKGESAYVSRFARLEGIADIKPPPHIEILPYSVAQGAFRPAESDNPFNTGKDYRANVGLDAKIGLTSNLTLDLTVNPDFGQVEVDPAVVNLSAYETYFEEKRPFFIEGSSIFNFGQGISRMNMSFNWMNPAFFYSRRIGRYPQGYVTAQGFVDFPDRTDILTAAKVSGKILSGWNLGFLSALTGREFAEIDSAGQRSRQEVEAFSYYGVLRSLKEFHEGRQGLGFMATAVVRDLRDENLSSLLVDRAFALALDGWTYLDKNKTWILNGWIGGTRTEGSPEAISRLQVAPQHYFQRPDTDHVDLDPLADSMQGWAARFHLTKQRGNILFNAAWGAISPGFESNDMGFQMRGDAMNGHVAVGYLWLKPGKLWRNANLMAAYFRSYDFGLNRTGEGVFLFGGGQFLNYWSVDGMVMFIPASYNNELTRGGPLARSLPYRAFDFGLVSDTRKKVVVRVGGRGGKSNSGSYDYQIMTTLWWRLQTNLSLEFGPGYNRDFSVAQWIRAVDDPLKTETYGQRYVFGEILQDTVFATFRLDWTFTPRASLQVYLQPFVSVGRYSRFKELDRARSFDFLVYGEEKSAISSASGLYTVDPDGDGPSAAFSFPAPDFNFKSLRGTMVFRWEYALGSTLYLVWTQNRQDFTHPGEFRLVRDIGLALSARGDNIFLIKMSYRWNF
jgi:hypothetical protein